MRHRLAVAAAVLSTAALAQAPATGQDHAAHHPSGASAPAPAFKGPANNKAATDATMKSMREMHDKMMAAKTPEERHALMADHMKVMQDGMAMMGRMKGAKPDGGDGRRHVHEPPDDGHADGHDGDDDADDGGP